MKNSNDSAADWQGGFDALKQFSKMPRVDFSDMDALEQRTDWYLSECAANGVRPTLISYAAALGIARETLWRIRAGYQGEVRGVTPAAASHLKKAACLIEASLAQQLVTAKSGQPALIFALKQHGWKDGVEVEQSADKRRETPATALASGKTPEEIAAYYLGDSASTADERGAAGQ